MKHKTPIETPKRKAVSFHLSWEEYQRFLKTLDPYVKVGSVVRAIVLKFIEQKEQKAA